MTDNIKYGPTGDGGYNTPFAVTVFYSENSIFQLAVAVLSEQCQAIPVGPDLSLLGDACEHPSPSLILFSNSKYTAEHLQKYFARGFQRIHIFADAESELETLSKIDSRISVFSLKDMHEGNFKLVNNLNAMYIIELICSGVYSEYKSFIGKINHQNGRAFIKYLQRTYNNPGDIGRLLIKLTLLMNGYEQVEEMCQRALGMEEERQLLARDRVQSSPLIGEKLYVISADLRNEIMRTELPKSAKYIILWYIRTDFKICVTVIKGPNWNEGDVTPQELVKPYCEECETAFDCILKDRSFIPFN